MPVLRLDKIISDMGFASRRDVKTLIKNGRVLVDGSVCKSGELKVNTDTAEIVVSGERLEYKKFVYIMMNKPGGYICAAEDARERTVLELLDERLRRRKLFTVGRLDKDTEGLLLLTDDGDYAHKVISPKSGIVKRYYARVRGELNGDDILKMQSGLKLGDGTECLPAELEILLSSPESECVISVSEGKYHQVKRMMASLNKPVLFLKRLAIGRLELDAELGPGEFRELTELEIELSLHSGKA